MTDTTPTLDPSAAQPIDTVDPSKSVYERFGWYMERQFKNDRVLQAIKDHLLLYPSQSPSLASTCICVAPDPSDKQHVVFLLPYYMSCRRVLYITHHAMYRTHVFNTVCGRIKDKDSPGNLPYLVDMKLINRDQRYAIGNVIETCTLRDLQHNSQSVVDMNIMSATLITKHFDRQMDPIMSNKSLNRFYDMIIVDEADRVKSGTIQHIQDYFGRFEYCNIVMMVSQASWSHQPHPLSHSDMVMTRDVSTPIASPSNVIDTNVPPLLTDKVIDGREQHPLAFDDHDGMTEPVASSVQQSDPNGPMFSHHG